MRVRLLIGLLAGVLFGFLGNASADVIPMSKAERERMFNSISVTYRLYSLSGKEVKVPHSLVLQCFDHEQLGQKKLWEDVVTCKFDSQWGSCNRRYHREKDFQYKGVLGGQNICQAQVILKKARRTFNIPATVYGSQFPLEYDRYAGGTTVFLRLQDSLKPDASVEE